MRAALTRSSHIGLASFFFVFGALPYWFKVHKHLNEVLGCWALTFPNGMPLPPLSALSTPSILTLMRCR